MSRIGNNLKGKIAKNSKSTNTNKDLPINGFEQSMANNTNSSTNSESKQLNNIGKDLLDHTRVEKDSFDNSYSNVYNKMINMSNEKIHKAEYVNQSKVISSTQTSDLYDSEEDIDNLNDSESLGLVEQEHSEEDRTFYEGQLLKWTNYFNGWQERHVIISHGNLSYYRSKNDISAICKCTVNLKKAYVRPNESDVCRFEIHYSNNSLFFKAADKEQCKAWIEHIDVVKKILHSMEPLRSSVNSVRSSMSSSNNSLWSVNSRDSFTSKSLTFKNKFNLNDEISQIKIFKENIMSKLESFQNIIDTFSEILAEKDVGIDLNDDEDDDDDDLNAADVAVVATQTLSSSSPNTRGSYSKLHSLVNFSKLHIKKKDLSHPNPNIHGSTISNCKNSSKNKIINDEQKSTVHEKGTSIFGNKLKSNNEKGIIATSTCLNNEIDGKNLSPMTKLRNKIHSSNKKAHCKIEDCCNGKNRVTSANRNDSSLTNGNLLVSSKSNCAKNSSAVDSTSDIECSNELVLDNRNSSGGLDRSAPSTPLTNDVSSICYDSAASYHCLHAEQLEKMKRLNINYKEEANSFHSNTLAFLSSITQCVELLELEKIRVANALVNERKKRKILLDKYRNLRENVFVSKNLYGPDYQEGPNSKLDEDTFYDAIEELYGVMHTNEIDDIDESSKTNNNSSIVSSQDSLDDLNSELAIQSVAAAAVAVNRHRFADQRDEKLMAALKFLIEPIDFSDANNPWQLSYSDGNTKIYKKTLELDTIVIDPHRLVSTFKGFSAKELSQWYFDPKSRPTWDVHIDTIRVVEKFGEDECIIHQLHKHIWPANRRDTCVFSIIKELNQSFEDLSPSFISESTRHTIPADKFDVSSLTPVGLPYIILNFSVDYSDLKGNDGCVRALADVGLLAQSFVSCPTGETPSRENIITHINYFGTINPGGWLPPAAVRAVARREFPNFIKNLYRFTTKMIAKQPLDI